MGILGLLFGKKSRDTQRVYCQGCNTDITNLGGYVSTKGEAYCGQQKPDGSRCITGGIPTVVSAEQLQDAVHGGHLTKYSSLEERTGKKNPGPLTRKFSTRKM